MSFHGPCKVLWRSPEDIQRKAAFVRTVFPVPSAPVFFTISGRGQNHFPVVSLWVTKLPWHHVQGIEDTLSHSSRDREVLLYFSDELAEVQKVTHYSKLHRQGLNPSLSSIKSFPDSGKKASIWIFCLLRMCFGKHLWTCRKWTCSNVILLEYSVIALPHFLFLLHIRQIKLTLDVPSSLSADLCPCSWGWELIAILFKMISVDWMWWDVPIIQPWGGGGRRMRHSRSSSAT